MATKTVWIVDAGYLIKCPLGHFDYLKLKGELEKRSGGPFFEAYYLNSTPNPPTDAQDAFHTWLKCAPLRGPKMRVKLYGLKDMHNNCPACGKAFDRQIQAGVDVGIATLIIKLASQGQYDRLILSAGDGDFEDAIDYVKSELHKEFWLSGYDGSVSADLQSYADKVIWMNEFWDDIKKM